MRTKQNILFLLTLLVTQFSFAQNLTQTLTQTIRGTVTDKASGEVLTGAVVAIVDIVPTISSATDMSGNFSLHQVPVGRRELVVNMIGYSPIRLNNITVNSGKELVLNLSMEESLTQLAVVEVTDDAKSQPINTMATVSSRTFSVEETQKFAAAVNDPSRMALSFAGVASGNDGGNIVSIRGNSPYALQWRMEGVEIPNPNHFGSVAVSGGGISILSAQTLSNSDFMTGAFPAEYGNTLGGVFDLKLRKGNNEKREYTIQAGVLGVDVAAEGPFAKNYDGSYLINYRYSTLNLLGKLNVPIGDALTNFQDLSFNFYLPSKKWGNFQLFGFGGLSSQVSEAVRDSSKWEYGWQRYDSRYISNTAAVGLKHMIQLSSSAYLQSSLVSSTNINSYEQERLNNELIASRDYEESYTNLRITASSILNYKLNAKNSFRAGGYYNIYGFDLFKKVLDRNINEWNTFLSDKGNVQTIQSFAQWKTRINEQWTITPGVHFLYLPFNGTNSFESRLGVKYQINEKNSISYGYGLHSQMQPVGVYKAHIKDSNGVSSQPNQSLELNKSYHNVLSYQYSFNKDLYAKVEAYYQYLFDIAVAADSNSTLSTLNNIDGYINEKMVSKGKGKNYGVELTLEQFTKNDFYFLLSTSLFNSQYKALDGVWRNTRFNFKHAVSFTAGKEWKVGNPKKNKTLGVNVRALYTGGMYETPVNLQASIAQGEPVFEEAQAFSHKIPNYFRTDLRVSLHRNYTKMSTTLSLDLQNATNNKNVFGNFFEAESGTMRTVYQAPLIPVLSYRVEF